MAAAPTTTTGLTYAETSPDIPPGTSIEEIFASYVQRAGAVAELEKQKREFTELQQSHCQLECQAAETADQYNGCARELTEAIAAANELRFDNGVLQLRADRAERENTTLKESLASLKRRDAQRAAAIREYLLMSQGYVTNFWQALGIDDDDDAAAGVAAVVTADDHGDRPDPTVAGSRQTSTPEMRTPAARAIEAGQGAAVPASTRASATPSSTPKPSSTPSSGSRNSAGFSLKKKSKNSNDRKRIKAVKSASDDSDPSGPASPRRPASGSSLQKAALSSPRRTFSANRFKSPVVTKKASSAVSPKAGGGGGGRARGQGATDKGLPRPTRSRSRAEAEAAAAKEAAQETASVAAEATANAVKAAADALSAATTPASSDSEEQDSQPGTPELDGVAAAGSEAGSSRATTRPMPCDVSLMEMNSEAFSQVIDRPPSPDFSAKKKHRSRSSFSPMLGRSPASPELSAKLKTQSRRRPCPSPMAGRPPHGTPAVARSPVPFPKAVDPVTPRTPLHQLAANQNESKRRRTQASGRGGCGPGKASDRRDLDAVTLDSMQAVDESVEESPAHYVEVVRKKDDREFMKGTDCAECMRYYKSVNDNNSQDARKHMSKISRHRFGKGCTHMLQTMVERKPREDAFWEIGFPDTQDDPAQAHLKNRTREPRTRRESTEYTESMTSEANLDPKSEPITTSGWLGGGKKEPQALVV